MGIVELIWHIAGFLAPALFMAVGLALLAPILTRKIPPARLLRRWMAVNFAVGAATLLAGLAITGHDGRVLTYAALVLACASAQAWQTKA
ncbi:MAG: hypothetical protein LBE78_02135 [Burkholderiaceae bacterium]|jgi:hypothetical protein|nr:hypothetical protein [Burkholderiaceae bacterium]